MLTTTSTEPGQDAIHHQEKPVPERPPAVFRAAHPTGHLIAAGVVPVEYVRRSEEATGHHTSVVKVCLSGTGSRSTVRMRSQSSSPALVVLK